MPDLDHSAATLRIFGPDLAPDEITRQLGCAPTEAAAKGEVLIGKTTGQKRVAPSGSWRLRAPEMKPGNLDQQIRDILAQVTADLNVWRELVSKYKVDMFCGLFMGSSNDGVTLSADTLAALGQRGIKLDLDIYDAKD